MHIGVGADVTIESEVAYPADLGFEQALLEHCRAEHGDVMATIRDKGELSGETEQKLTEILEAFLKNFV